MFVVCGTERNMMDCSDAHKSALSIRPRNNIYNRTRGSLSCFIPETVLLLAYQPKAQGIYQYRLCPLQHLLREGDAVKSSDCMLPRDRVGIGRYPGLSAGR